MVKSRHYHPIEILLDDNIISVRWWSSDLRIPKIGWQTCSRTVILVWAFAVSGDREVNHLGNSDNRDTGVQNDAECTVKLLFYHLLFYHLLFYPSLTLESRSFNPVFLSILTRRPCWFLVLRSKFRRLLAFCVLVTTFLDTDQLQSNASL